MCKKNFVLVSFLSLQKSAVVVSHSIDVKWRKLIHFLYEVNVEGGFLWRKLYFELLVCLI